MKPSISSPRLFLLLIVLALMLFTLVACPAIERPEPTESRDGALVGKTVLSGPSTPTAPVLPTETAVSTAYVVIDPSTDPKVLSLTTADLPEGFTAAASDLGVLPSDLTPGLRANYAEGFTRQDSEVIVQAILVFDSVDSARSAFVAPNSAASILTQFGDISTLGAIKQVSGAAIGEESAHYSTIADKFWGGITEFRAGNVLAVLVYAGPTNSAGPVAADLLAQRVADHIRAAGSSSAALSHETVTPISLPTQASPVAAPSAPQSPTPRSTEGVLNALTSQPPKGMGSLLVKLPESCLSATNGGEYTLNQSGAYVGTGWANKGILVAPGTYKLGFYSVHGLPDKQVTIEAGKTTTLDLTRELGVLQLNGYPELSMWTPYSLDRAGEEISLYNHYAPRDPVCLPLGAYTVSLLGMRFSVELKGGTTVVGPEAWPQQLGILTLKAPDNSTQISGKIYDANLDKPDAKSSTSLAGQNWLSVGAYKIVLTQPSVGLILGPFEVKAGEETLVRVSSTGQPIAPQTTSPTAGVATPNSTATSQTAKGMGSLLVKYPESCLSASYGNGEYSLKQSGAYVGTGWANKGILVAPGTYKLDLYWVAGFPDRQVTIEEGKSTTLDLTRELGVLQLNGYPELQDSMIYRVYQGSDELTSGMNPYVGSTTLCLPLGTYSVKFGPMWLDNAGLDLTANIAGGKTTVVGPETWPKQLGIVTLKPQDKSTPVSGKIYDAQTGMPFSKDSWSLSERMWLPVGTYKFVLTEPYIGLTVGPVEVKAGQETIVPLLQTTP